MASGMVNLFQLILLLGVFDRSLAFWSDFELSTVDDMNGTTGLPLVFDLRSKRIKNGLYGVSGTVTVTDSLDGYDTEVKLYQSSKGGNDWKQAPIMLLRAPVCQRVDNEFRKYLMEDMHAVSDFPYTQNAKELLCPMFEQKKYEMKNFIFDSSKISSYLQSGLYKVHILLVKAGELTSGLEVVVSLS